MFRDQYKAVFNGIAADRTQIDKIFDVAEKSTNKKTKIVPFRYVGTLAAAIMVVIAVTMFPNFSQFFGTEQKEYDPVGIVNYGSDKTWDNTAITSGSVQNEDNIVTENKENNAIKNRTVAEQPGATAEKKTADFDVSVPETEALVQPENTLAVAMNIAENAEAVMDDSAEESTQAKFMMKASSGGSSAPFELVEESLYDCENGSVKVSVFSKHNEIETVLADNESDLLVISESLAYAKKDGKLYKFAASGLTKEEFEKFVNENL